MGQVEHGLKVVTDYESPPYVNGEEGKPWIVGYRDASGGFTALAMFEEEAEAKNHAVTIQNTLDFCWEVVAPDPESMIDAINRSMMEAYEPE